MFKRIEDWLRSIFADEVATIEKALVSELKRIETSFTSERVKYLAEMRAALAEDLTQFRADLVAERLLVHTPPNWPGDNQGIARPDAHYKADLETVKADHQLRHPRPTRR